MEDLGVGPNLEDRITPKELAELIKITPDPLVDAPKLMMDDDPGKAARKYIESLKQPGGVILKLTNISRHASNIETCGDCREHVSGGSISLIRAENPEDVNFGNEAALNMGFLNVTISPDSQLKGKVHRVAMTPMTVHQIEKHNNYDASRYAGSVKIDPKAVLDVIRPSVKGPQVNITQASSGK